MKVAFTLLALCVVLATAINIKQGDEYSKFTQFMSKYGKTYSSTAEWDSRFEIFKANLKKLEQLNAEEQGSAIHGITKFADMSAEEFKTYPCGGDLSRFPNPRIPVTHADEAAPSDIPTEFDWTTKGAVTPVKDQGMCGSCWAFSTIANIEGANFLAGHPLTSLSESELVDCSSNDDGCSGGWPFWALEDILKAPYNGRIDTEASYPYSAANGKCKFNANNVGATVTNYTNYCHEGTTACTETQMQTLLMNKGPLSVCLDANPMQLYTSGVSQPKNCDPTAIDHCIALVGWGVDASTNLPYWKLKNSWGTTWGEQGYYRLIRGVAKDQPDGRCGINTVVTATAVQK